MNAFDIKLGRGLGRAVSLKEFASIVDNTMYFNLLNKSLKKIPCIRDQSRSQNYTNSSSRRLNLKLQRRFGSISSSWSKQISLKKICPAFLNKLLENHSGNRRTKSIVKFLVYKRCLSFSKKINISPIPLRHPL